MKNCTIILLVGLILGSCLKPKYVEKRITKGSWTISAFSIDNENLAGNYASYSFAFGTDGYAIVSGGFSAQGTWELGLDTKPTILYLSFPVGGNLEYLSDDWRVVESKKSLLRLEKNDDGGSSSGTLVFKK